MNFEENKHLNKILVEVQFMKPHDLEMIMLLTFMCLESSKIH